MSCIISSAVVTVLALAWNARWNAISVTSSLLRSTFEASTARAGARDVDQRPPRRRGLDRQAVAGALEALLAGEVGERDLRELDLVAVVEHAADLAVVADHDVGQLARGAAVDVEAVDR